MAEQKTELSKYKAHAISVARQLFYGDDIIDEIKKATTENEVTRALRHGRLKED